MCIKKILCALCVYIENERWRQRKIGEKEKTIMTTRNGTFMQRIFAKYCTILV